MLCCVSWQQLNLLPNELTIPQFLIHVCNHFLIEAKLDDEKGNCTRNNIHLTNGMFTKTQHLSKSPCQYSIVKVVSIILVNVSWG